MVNGLMRQLQITLKSLSNLPFILKVEPKIDSIYKGGVARRSSRLGILREVVGRDWLFYMVIVRRK